jgi:hypothetical protein
LLYVYATGLGFVNFLVMRLIPGLWSSFHVLRLCPPCSSV